MNSRVRTRLAAATALMAAAALLGGCSTLFPPAATRDADTQEVTEAGQADVFSMRVGDCFDDTEGEEITDVPVVPCAEPHDNEAYFAFDMPDGEWPGDAAIEAAADETCTAEFESFVGIAYEESTLDWYPVTPTEGGWEELDDREIVCAIFDGGLTKVEGSLAGVAY